MKIKPGKTRPILAKIGWSAGLILSDNPIRNIVRAVTILAPATTCKVKSFILFIIL